MALRLCAAGLCTDDTGRLLMVLQGRPGEAHSWAVPGGRLEPGETLEECCIREVWEESGYRVRVLAPAWIKRGAKVLVHYFRVQAVAGSPTVQDPCGFIHAVAWQTPEAMQKLRLSFPEDLGTLLNFLAAAAAGVEPGHGG